MDHTLTVTYSLSPLSALPVTHVSYSLPFTFIFYTFHAFTFSCICLGFLFVCFSVRSLSCLMFPRMCWPTVFSRTYSSAWLQKYRVLFHSDLRSTTPVQPTTPVEFPDSNNHNIHYTIQSFLIYRHTHHRTSLHFLSFYTTSPYPPPQLQPPHPPPPTQENLQLRHYPSTRN